MLLPAPLFEAIAHHIPHHVCWHTVRGPGQAKAREAFRGECDRRLRGIDEPGSGCDFLAFHRRMMRHFKHLLQTIPVESFRFEPWPGPRLPDWVEHAVAMDAPAFDLEAAYEGIEDLVINGTADHLGGFIESNELHENEPGAGLHIRVHKGIGRFELSLYPGDDTSPMTSPGRSPGNIFFWTLHEWIDDRYAAWQTAHGEVVDRSPLEMDDPHVDCTRLLGPHT